MLQETDHNGAQPGPSGENDAAEALKKAGNEYFAKQNYKKALESFSAAIERSEKDTEIARVSKCNRAECYLKLSQPQPAQKDCEEVIAAEPSPETPTSRKITLKAHFRLARCLKELGKQEDALIAVANYEKAGGAAEHIAQFCKDLEASIASRNATDTTAHSAAAGTRPIRYEVKIYGHDPIVFAEHAHPALCVPRPPEALTKAYLLTLVSAHDAELMRVKAWRCWNGDCNRPAESMVHTPCSWMHLPDPMVVDFVQPVCVTGGTCELEAKAMVASTLAELHIEAS